MSPAPRLTSADRVAVFLDFDGTLVEIAEHPGLVHVPDTLLDTIQAVHDHQAGALALVSGRSIDDLDRLIAPLHLPIAGVHGAQHRDANGKHAPSESTPIPAAVRDLMRRLESTNPGLLLEDKGDGLALHYRNAPECEDLLRSELEEIFTDFGQDFLLQDGKMVLEVRPAGASKGTAVRRFMDDPPFRGRRPVFVGDDVTDEDAFRVVNDMDGISVKVGAAGVETTARYRLPDVDAVRDWLKPLATG